MSYFPYFVGGRGHLVTPPFLPNLSCIPPANVRLPPLLLRNIRSLSSYPLWKTWFPHTIRPTPFIHYSDLPLPAEGNVERRQDRLQSFLLIDSWEGYP